MRTLRSLYFAGFLVTVLGLDVAERGDGPRLDVELVADGLVAPVDLTFSPDRSHRRFIVDQTGLVLILTPEGTVLPTPFLDISDRVVIQSAFDERGLLALGFHPRFARNGKLYVQYSAAREGPNICVGEDGHVPHDPGGCPLQYTRRVSEFRVSATDPNRVDPSTERVIFKIQWPGRKHNGGGLAFGPDGMLYIGLGDGGFVHGPSGADDPFNVDPQLLFGDLVAQNLTSLYGKILRIDVDRGDPYRIPPDNPFAGQGAPGHRHFPPEIYAWGFRNPFRISFDRAGDRAMYVSGPAETLFEATYKVTRPGNYGWAAKEGTHCIVRTSAFAPPETITCSGNAQCPVGPQVSMCGRKGVCTCPRVGPLGEPIRNPVIEYLNFAVEDQRSRFPGHGFGRASLGGHVYRGKKIEWLRGRFVQGDFALNLLDGQILVAKKVPGKLWKLRRAFVFDPADAVKSGFLKSIGQDAAGELYAVTGNFTPTGLQGRVWKIIDGSE
jgi:glucose/arabinose dehydrogenase